MGVDEGGDGSAPSAEQRYASRAGAKLDAAIEAFGVDVAGLTCADLGCSTGGFTDCLLQRGAAKVYAVDTGYGVLAWKLRNEPRVVVMERTNALHAEPPEPCDLVTIDLGWTRQDKALPAARRWLSPEGRIITLIKPHYESGDPRIDDDAAEVVAVDVLDRVRGWGWQVRGPIRSPVRGGKGGNIEFLALLQPHAER